MADHRGWWWKVIVIVVFGLVLARGWACGAGRRGPDERLAQHFERLCKIAERGVDHPKDGVHRFMRYLGDHSPDMLADFAATLVLIERIDDDAAHDRRARTARDRMRAPLRACERTWEDFSDAVEDDPEAAAAFERGVNRLGRTLEIVLGDSDRGMPIDPRALLRRLDPDARPR